VLVVDELGHVVDNNGALALSGCWTFLETTR
jgi:hypothetical protein